MAVRPPVVVPMKLSGGLVKAFGGLSHLKGSFLLDSVTEDRKEGRYSFAGIEPVHTFSSKGGFVTIDGHTLIDDPLRALKKLIKLARGIDVDDNYLPFSGGLVGFIGSEWGNDPSATSTDSNIPDLSFGLYDTIATIDHLEGTAWVSSFGLGPDGEVDLSLAKERAERFASLLQTSDPLISTDPEFYPPLLGTHPIIASINKDAFIGGVRTLKKEEHLPLFARQFMSPTHKSPWRIYLELRGGNQAAYAAYLNLGDLHVLSASRTRLIKIENETISVKPTKGYAGRSADPIEEAKRLNDLKYHPEIQGSHRYIVSDVIRSLGEVCKVETIEADEVAHIESDVRAHHLVTNVRGEKLKGAATIDCVLKVMQAFSDIRSVPLLSMLEGAPRNVYTGTIGFIGVNGSSEFNFAFRTLILKDTIGYLHAGAEIGSWTDEEEAFLATERAAKQIFELCQKSI